MEYSILKDIKSPQDIKKLNKNELSVLCDEIRNCIIETVSKNGGHLASNLGSVELTVALHRVFNSPEDAIIFDVGHQCYTHKLLTGRFDKFASLRTEGGISGFMRPSESEHDPFITGHSSNSISAAFGIFKAKKLLGQKGTAVAVIGDGAMTGGMAYEALNNAGSSKGNFIVILNDNEMSISENVGSLARSLTKMRNKPRYHKFKNAIAKILMGIPFIGKYLKHVISVLKDAFKTVIYKKNIFTSLGFDYLGPVDGHNISQMEDLFKIAYESNEPSLIHVVTTKGKGYSLAEEFPKNYHGVSPFDISEGCEVNKADTFSSIAGKTLCKLAETDSKICAITAAMTEGTGFSEFQEKFPERFFDVGIAEQHAVTFSAGLSKQGAKPFFVVYSSFLQRAYDQLVHDVATEGLPLRLLIDRAGIVGEDGETHQGVFDISFLTSVPKIQIYSPATHKELEYRIEFAAQNDKNIAIRYPRGAVPKNFFPAVEKGLRECTAKGVLAGFPLVGLKATLVDGSYHPVDSSEMAFKMAAAIAYKEGIPQTSPALLEPIGTLKVLVPDEMLGDVIGDINKRRGRIIGMNPAENKMQEIIGEVPMAEMSDFATAMRSITQGTATFTLEHARYEEVPQMIAQKIIDENKQ